MKLSRAIPRMNQLGLMYDLRLWNARHFKLLKYVIETERLSEQFSERRSEQCSETKNYRK